MKCEKVGIGIGMKCEKVIMICVALLTPAAGCVGDGGRGARRDGRARGVRRDWMDEECAEDGWLNERSAENR